MLHKGSSDCVPLVQADTPGVDVGALLARTAALLAPFDGPCTRREWLAYGEGRADGVATTWDARYAEGYCDGLGERAARAEHAQLCEKLRPALRGPVLTDMTGDSESLRQRAQERERAAIERFRADHARRREAS